MRRSLRWLGRGLVVLLVLAGVLFLGVLWLTGSRAGKERARRFAEAWLADSPNIAGQISLGSIDGGSLLRGVTVHGIDIIDPTGRPFLHADSVSASYDWFDLLRGRISIGSLRAYGAVVQIERLPGDSLWNYQRVFVPSPPGPQGPGRLIAFDDVRLVGGALTIRLPWEGSAAAAERWVIEDVPGGRARVVDVQLADTRSTRIQWEAPGDRDKRIALSSFEGTVRVFREPMEIRSARGAVTLTDSAISVDLREFRLPATHGNVRGRIARGEAGNGWEFLIDAEKFALADLGWIDARVPAEGTGRARVRIARETAAADTDFRIEDIDLEAPGTRIAGSAGFRMGRTLVFRGVDLRASSLDPAWIGRALEREMPVQGVLSGSLTADGPLSRMQTRGDVRLNGPAGRMSGRWTGGVSLDRGFGARSLNIDLQNADLTLLDAFAPDLPVRGSISGRTTLDGRLTDSLTVRGAWTHNGATGAVSALQGGGTIRGATDIAVDLAFDVAPLDLGVLAAAAPSLERLRGEARGRIAVRGVPTDLTVDADVRTSAGPVRVTARVDRSGTSPRVVADGRVTGFTPDRIGLLEQDLSVSGAFAVDIEGAGLEEARGRVRVVVDSAVVRSFPVDAARLDVELESGNARIDSAFVQASGIEVTGRGDIGLDSATRGRLEVAVHSSSLAPLESWRFGEIVDPTQPRVRGALDGRATVSGSIASFDVDATARLDGFGWEAHQAVRIALDLTGTGLRSDSAAWELGARIDSLLVMGRQGDSAHVVLAGRGGQLRGQADVWSDTLSVLRGSASWSPADGGGTLRIADLGFRSQDRVWALREAAVVDVEEGLARVAPFRIVPARGTGSLGASGTIALFSSDPAEAAQGLDFDVDITGMPFGEFMSIVRSPVDAAGVMDGALRVTGTTARPLIRGEVTIRDVEFEETPLELVTAAVDYADRSLQASATAFQDGRQVMTASGNIPLDLTRDAGERRPDLPLSLTMRMDSFPAAFALGPLPGFSGLGGLIDGTVHARGTTREPALDGTLLVRRGAATWDVTGVRYVDVEGTLRTSGELVVALDLTARTVDLRGRTPAGTRGGGLRLTGQVDLESPGNPGLDLELTADRILAARRRDADVITSGAVTVTGQYRRPTIGGNLTIESGNLYLDEIYRQYLIVELEDPLLFNLVDTTLVSVRRFLPPSQSPFVRNMRIDNVDVTVNAGSWMRSREMDVEVTGNLLVIFDRQQEDLRLSGTLNAIRGTYRLEYPPFARVFEVEEGTVEFPGTPGIDPLLNIVASHTARTRDEPLRIEAVLTGSLQLPRVRLRSDAEPPISESDLASYLFFGAPTWGIAAGSPGGGGAFGSLGRQALTATGLGYVASGLQTLAQSFGLVDYVGLTAAEAGAPGQQSGIENLLASTRIELGRYLSPRVYVAYTQRLGSPANDAGVRLEWRYHPTYTLELFAEDRFARAPSVTLSQAIAARKVYGFFIYREWSY